MSQHRRKNRSEAEWAALVTEFQGSGLSQLAFCEQRGVNVYSFRRRYQRSEQFAGKRRQTSAAAFTELPPPRSTPPVGIVVRVAEQVRIECPPQMDMASVAELVRDLIDVA